MANDEKPRASVRSGKAAETAKQRMRATERPFDMWLQKQLHAMYDEIAGEPLPGDLLNMIDRDAAKLGDRKENLDEHDPRGKKGP